MLVLVWMIAALGSLTREERKKVVLSYDNMCHLDNLRVARKPLPLPGDLKFLWLDIKKIIDTLHIYNHKDPKCHQPYNWPHVSVSWTGSGESGRMMEWRSLLRFSS